MKKILVSLGVIGVVGAIAVGGTIAYFSDTESSTGNTFAAGEIDLKVDMRCDKVGCGFPEKDLEYNDPLFYNCDIKPGDKHETTLSFHVYNNDAWGRMKVTKIGNFEYGCNEPEATEDSTCGNPGKGEGELMQNIYFTVWVDEGNIKGWQCPSNQPECSADPFEGDNKLNGIEQKIVADARLSDFAEQYIDFPDEIKASSTYYLGVEWTVPSDVTNIIQSDSLIGTILLEAVQSRNNPDRIFP